VSDLLPPHPPPPRHNSQPFHPTPFTPGEDPLVVSQLGAAVIRGIQGVTVIDTTQPPPNPSHQSRRPHPPANSGGSGWRFDFNTSSAYVPEGAAACAKHFVAYSAPESGHDRTPVSMPLRELHQYFLPPWKAAMEAGEQLRLNRGIGGKGLGYRGAHWVGRVRPDACKHVGAGIASVFLSPWKAAMEAGAG
jgi:hypothetical protein